MRVPSVLLALVVASTASLRAEVDLPRFDPRGIDDKVREIAGSGAATARVTACMANLVRATWTARDTEARERDERRVSGLLAVLPAVAARDGVDPGRRDAVLALALMPVVTRSLTLDPTSSRGGGTPVLDVETCRRLADGVSRGGATAVP